MDARECGIFPGRRILLDVPDEGGYACYDVPYEPCERAWAGASDSGGVHGSAAGGSEQSAVGQDGPGLAVHMVRAGADGRGSVPGCIQRDVELGSEPRSVGIRACGSGADHAGEHAEDTGEHAQCERGADIPAGGMERVRHTGPGGCGLPRLQDLWPPV